MSDLRLAARMLGRNRGTTLIIVALLALGIGGTTLLFSVFDAVVLRPLPVRHPEQLVRLVQRLPVIGIRSSFGQTYYQNLRAHATTLTGVFGESGEFYRFVMSDPAPAEPIVVHFVTPGFFEALGAPALYGRTLTAGDAQENPGLIPAVLSHGFWRRRFNGDPHAIGRTLTLHGHRFVIVGIMPRDFNGFTVDTAPDVRVPFRAWQLVSDLKPEISALDLAARLKPGVTRQQAAAECLAIWRSTMAPIYRDVDKEPPEIVSALVARGMDLDPLERGVSILRDHFGGALKLLMASAALLLLIVCTNVVGLLLAQTSARRQEIAVRLAMGASRARLVRQTLAEGFLLAILGSVGGLILASFEIPLAQRALPPLRDLGTSPLSVALDVRIDLRVFLFSLGLSLAALLLFSLSPALACTRTSLDSVLRAVRATGGNRTRRALIVLQIAASTFLLASAALFVRTFAELRALNPGFDTGHLATFTLDPDALGQARQPGPVLKRLIGRVRELPGVASVAIASRGVMRGYGVSTTVAPAGQQITRAHFLDSNENTVTAGYFETMGIDVLAGRALLERDTPADQPVPPVNVDVNQVFARRFFPNSNSLGRSFGTGAAGVARANYRIVGVVSDAKYRSLREPLVPTFYVAESLDGYLDSSIVLNVRTRGRPDSILEPVRKALAATDPTLAFREVHTMDDEVDASLSPDRLVAILASIFGSVAVLLAGVGLYGVFASALIQRRREIGVRMALGARPRHIGRLFGSEALVMSAIGIALGLGAALAAGPAIRSLLYGISPEDPASLAAAALFVVLVAAMGTAGPARRAVLIDPAAALRQDN